MTLLLPRKAPPIKTDRRHASRIDVVFPIHNSKHAKIKRSIDVVISGFLLVLLWPIIAIVAALIKVTSRGPALFIQERVGQGGQTIEVRKFRTMRVDGDRLLRADDVLWQEYLDNDHKLETERDPRVTRIGRVLRRTSMDELPQLLDVFNGRLSMVGPRPVIIPELSRYGPYLCAYLAVRPGLTGKWQVSGRANVAYPMRAKIDFEYVNKWSLTNDLRIILQTIPAVLSGTGAH